MSKPRKPPAWDWRAREIDDWNTTTVRAYLKDKHEEEYGIPYVPKHLKMECGMIKRMLDNHGPEITKEFIDECFRDYTPTPQYPGLSFWFMYSYMKSRVLPRVLENAVKNERRQSSVKVPKVEDVKKWL